VARRERFNRQARVNLRQELYALPKVDLHRHLEGSLRLKTLAEIAQEHGLDLPSYDIEQLRPYVQVTNDPPDFHRFLEKFRLLRRFYTTPEAVKRVAYEAVADAAEDNVRYLELRLNPEALAEARRFSLSDVADWVIEAVHQAQADYDIQVRLIAMIRRDKSLENAWEIARLAIERRDDGFVGLDLAGDEVNYPATPFISVFQAAKEAGLGITIHAGEHGSAENVREAICEMGADRIGHGVRSIENHQVIQLLREHKTVLEVCPTSNLQTGVMHSFAHHPLRDLYYLGVRATINTDDPSVSDTTLTDEYLVAVMGIGIAIPDIKQMILYAAEGAFLPPDEKAALIARLRQEMGIEVQVGTEG